MPRGWRRSALIRASSLRSPCAPRRRRSGPSRRRSPATAWGWRSASSGRPRSIFRPRAVARFAPATKGVTGFLLRLGNGSPEASAAELRFRVSPAPAGKIGSFAAGIGRMAWRRALEKNRLGRTGAFTVEWNSHERSFVERGAERGRERGEGGAADSEPLSAAPFDRPSDPPERRASVTPHEARAARHRGEGQECDARRRRRCGRRGAGHPPWHQPCRCARRGA